MTNKYLEKIAEAVEKQKSGMSGKRKAEVVAGTVLTTAGGARVGHVLGSVLENKALLKHSIKHGYSGIPEEAKILARKIRLRGTAIGAASGLAFAGSYLKKRTNS